MDKRLVMPAFFKVNNLLRSLSYKPFMIAQITSLLTLLVTADEVETSTPQCEVDTIEMLTVKECTVAGKGLSEHSVRQLVVQEKIPYIRTGQGKHGKILINKSALLSYFNCNA